MSGNVTRRRFLSGSSALAAAAAVAGSARTARTAPKKSTKASAAHKKCFMDQYYDGIMAIARGIRDTQIDTIARAMEKAYEVKRRGGSLYSQVVYGHYSAHAGSSDIPGQPNLLPQCWLLPTESYYDAMKEGDFLITDMIDDGVKAARGKGVFVVGVTNNYFKFAQTPPGALIPERMETAIEEVSDLVIDSYTPWYNGLVSAPQITEFKLCPSTGIAQYLVYWSCTASLANLVGTKGKGSSTEPIIAFLDLALERFRLVGTDRPKIDMVASKWADFVLERHARLLVYGEPFTIDGHQGNMFVSDACGAASGSMICQPYSGDVRKDDIVLIGSVRSNGARDGEVARSAKMAGAYTAAFCPYATDGDSSGDRLYKEVDDAFNTYSDESAGVIAVRGFEEKVAPMAGLTGNLILWMLTAQWTDHMARRGEMPYYWMGFHENGGGEYDNAVRPYFLKRGY